MNYCAIINARMTDMEGATVQGRFSLCWCNYATTHTEAPRQIPKADPASATVGQRANRAAFAMGCQIAAAIHVIRRTENALAIEEGE